MCDLIIIGAGPAGIACGIEAHKKGLNYVILEKGYLVNSIYKFPTNMQFFSTSKNLEIGEIPFISHSDKPSRAEALEYYRRIAQSFELNIHYLHRVTSILKTRSGFEVEINNSKFMKCRFLVVASGYYDNPRLLNIPGEHLPKVKHYYDDAHPYIGTDVLVIGAANSACDVALETWNKGARVTMAIRDSELYQKVKYWILPNIENRIKEGSINAHFNTEVIEIKPDTVILRKHKKTMEIDNDYVLAMTGYMPDYKFLTTIGLKFNKDEGRTPVINEKSLESSVTDLYLAGVVVSGMHTSKLFIENTRHHGQKIIADIMQKING